MPVLCEEELLDICSTKGVSTTWAFAMPGLQVFVDALLTEHMPALGDNDVLHACVTHIAFDQPLQRDDLLLQLLHSFTGVGILSQASDLASQHLHSEGNGQDQMVRDGS